VEGVARIPFGESSIAIRDAGADTILRPAPGVAILRDVRCAFCAEEIPEGSAACPLCGERQATAAPAGPRVVGFELTKTGSRVMFEGATPEQAAQSFSAFFRGLGYTLTSSDPMVARFEKGSAAARVLAGGFANRSKYTVTLTVFGANLGADVSSAMSGTGGGWLGMSKERKQRAAIASQLQAYLGRYGAPSV
jgi:hypothetical protein